MASALLSNAITRNKPAPTADSNTTITVREEYDILAALVINDTIDFVKIPVGYVPVDVTLDSDDLDTGTAVVLSVGLRKADGTTDAPACFIVGSTVGQAGGVARAAVKEGFRLAAATVERNVYVTVTTAPTTSATSGKIGVTVSYRPA